MLWRFRSGSPIRRPRSPVTPLVISKADELVQGIETFGKHSRVRQEIRDLVDIQCFARNRPRQGIHPVFFEGPADAKHRYDNNPIMFSRHSITAV